MERLETNPDTVQKQDRQLSGETRVKEGKKTNEEKNVNKENFQPQRVPRSKVRIG